MIVESMLNIQGSIVPHDDRLQDRLILTLLCEEDVVHRLTDGLSEDARRDVQRRVSAVCLDAMMSISRILRSAS